ncbi:hypothetical protein GQ457_03G017700 [Hibiscus cannabinus]
MARNTFGTIKKASKHQEKTNASLYNINMIKNCLRFPPKPRKGDEFNSELVEILSGEAKVVDVELGYRADIISFLSFRLRLQVLVMLVLTLSFACNSGGIVVHLRIEFDVFYRSFAYDANMILKW